MAGESTPSAPRFSRRVVPARLASRAPSLRTAIVVFIAVLILFRWLHLILALDITSTGRQIQLRTEELGQHNRAIADLKNRIAVAESPSKLSDRAQELGYGPANMVYLLLDHALAPLTAGNTADKASVIDQQSEQREEAGLLTDWGTALQTWEETGSEQ